MGTGIQVIPFETQDYVSVQHGDDRIDMYVSEPAAGVGAATGLMLLLHGWGNDGQAAYAAESQVYADRLDVVVTRVEYRHSGREARHPTSGRTYDQPYDFSKYQTIDCLRAACATLRRYPQIDHERLILWGGSQGAHLAAQCLIFAPHLWALAVLVSGVYRPITYADSQRQGFALDLQSNPGLGFTECALGAGKQFEPAEEDIRNPLRNAALIPDNVPIILIHGTEDHTVDIRHSVVFYARLLREGRRVQFFAVENGDHGMEGAARAEEDTRLKATFLHGGQTLQTARRPEVNPETAPTVRIPVRGGVFEVTWPESDPVLRFNANEDENLSP